MIGKAFQSNPTVYISPWDPLPYPTAIMNTTVINSSPDIQRRYIPYNSPSYESDQFRMFELKIRMCARGRSHDWTECPYAHSGEKARRRDPRRFHYSGDACPEFRTGLCIKGDSCEFAHGVFECWLHPTRYRTQPCKDGESCHRQICFFAHSPEQLRVINPCHGSGVPEFGSPTSALKSVPFDSPPESPSSRHVGCESFESMSEVVSSMRKVKIGIGNVNRSMLGVGFRSVPLMPTMLATRKGHRSFSIWDSSECEEDAKDTVNNIYGEVSIDNSVDIVESGGVSGPDIGWILELVK